MWQEVKERALVRLTRVGGERLGKAGTMPQDYYPGGPFLSQLPDAGEFDMLREDFLLGFAERTARAYRADLEDFREWSAVVRVDALGSSPTDVERYLRSLLDRGYAAGTVTRRAAALRGFLRHLQARRSTNDLD